MVEQNIEASPALPLTTVCAWCVPLGAARPPETPSPSVSHTICPGCEARYFSYLTYSAPRGATDMSDCDEQATKSVTNGTEGAHRSAVSLAYIIDAEQRLVTITG